MNMAFVGVGGQGWNDISMFLYHRELFNAVALCDTQMGAPHTMRAVREFPGARRFTDFRKMFDEVGKDIDAVCVATPDFSHFPAVMQALATGKAVYCEKPLGNCFREVELMTRAAARSGAVTQMGNQGHSGANYWQMKALTESGYLKDVTRIDAFMCANNRRWFKWNGGMKKMPPAEEKLEGLDWDAWQAQRPERGFNRNFIYGDWRCFWEYGTGTLGDWGAHIFDAAHEFLKLGLPVRIETLKNDRRTEATYPMASTLAFTFAAREGMPECRLVWHDGAGNFPEEPKGVTDAKWRRGQYGAELHTADGRTFARTSHGAPLQLIAGGDASAPETKRAMRDYPRKKSDHYLNFLRAVRGEERANSGFAVGGPLSQAMALGAIAQRLGEKTLEFDPEARRFTNSERANALLAGPPVRKGWEAYEKMV